MLDDGIIEVNQKPEIRDKLPIESREQWKELMNYFTFESLDRFIKDTLMISEIEKKYRELKTKKPMTDEDLLEVRARNFKIKIGSLYELSQTIARGKAKGERLRLIYKGKTALQLYTQVKEAYKNIYSLKNQSVSL